jgi:PAS domain S-box-containing protein
MPYLRRHRLRVAPAESGTRRGRSEALRAAGFAGAVGVACYLAARFCLALHAEVGVPIFAPAAGMAVGALIALEPGSRRLIAASVAVATLASNLAVGRSPWLALALALISAGQALVVAWLVERWFGGTFKLDDVPRVLGFVLASAAGTALGATGAATVMVTLKPVAFLYVWRLWFAACLLGTLTVAPFLIGLGEALRDRPSRRELMEGIAAVGALGALGSFLVSLPHQPWNSALPAGLMVPAVLWLTVRCRPVFAAAAVSLLVLTTIWAIASNIGHFGDTSIPLADRVLAAQTHLLVGSLLAIVLAALFAERRAREALLEGSNERLRIQEETSRRLLGSLPAAIYTTDQTGRITYCNQAAAALWGRVPELGKHKWSDLWRLHYADGTSVPPDQRPDQIVLSEGRTLRGGEALLERSDGSLVPIMPCPAPLLDDRGETVGVVNMQLDLTEQKRAEAALAERDTLLTLASKAARVGSYALDCTTEVVRLTPGCAAVYGLAEGTTELSRADCRATVHPEDLAGLDRRFTQAFMEQQREIVAQFRIIRPNDGEIRWIETRALISYRAGLPWRIVGIDIDLTERKTAEAETKERESRLADALAAGQVIAFEWNPVARRSQRSGNAAAILGSEEEEGECGSRSESFFQRVHPDDRERFKACIRALRPNKPSYALSFRFRGVEGRQLWLEETAKAEFDATGRLLRIKGLTRDITDRKEAECALADRNMQMSLAARAALVGSFSFDVETEEIQAFAGYAAIHGLPEDCSRTTSSRWRLGVHPEDVARVEHLQSRAIREQRREYATDYRIVRDTGEIRWIETRCFISYRRDGRPDRMVGVNIDVTARKRAEEHQRVLVAELDHRVKNVLATVSAVASRTQSTSLSGADFAARLAGRIQSMAATHELLSCRQWKGVSVRELVARELMPYMTRDNTNLNGSDFTLSPEAGQTLSMVLHELTTNAAKHGALSTDEGVVSVRWHQVRSASPDACICIEWQETRGPVVQPPRRSSYGTEVIRNLIPYQLGGTVDLIFAREGLQCVISIPVCQLSQSSTDPAHRLIDARNHERELSVG